MESRVSRLERYKDNKKHKKIIILQRFMLFLSVTSLIWGIYAVDLTVSESLLLQNQQVFQFEATDESYRVHLFGEDYSIQKAVIDGTYSRMLDGYNQVKGRVKELITDVVER